MRIGIPYKIALVLALSSCNAEESKVKEAVIKYIGSGLNATEKENLQISYSWTTEKEHIDALRQKYLHTMNSLHDLSVSKHMLDIETNGARNIPPLESGYLDYYGAKIDSLNAITDVSDKVIKVSAFVLSSNGDTGYKNTIWLDDKFEVKK